MAGSALATPRVPFPTSNLTSEDRQFLDDFGKRCFLYFTEQVGPKTGIVMDRAAMDGAPDAAMSAAPLLPASASPLSALAPSRGWTTKERARAQVLVTLRYFWQHAFHDHGWFYHFMDVHTGERRLNSEISSIDTALLLCGVLTVAGYFQS